MDRALLISIAIAMGLIFSPESLIVIGHGVGNTGVIFVLAVSLASILYLPTIVCLSLISAVGGEIPFLKAVLGPIASTSTLLCSRVAFTLCALPIMMSTAGFVFNETFLYSFPNFLFAHLLLLTIALINIASRRAAETFQVFLVTITLASLMTLSIIGLVSTPPPILEFAPQGVFPSLKFMLTAMMLFIGFDIMFLSGRKGLAETHAAMSAVIIAAMAFTLWALVSFFHVPLSSLANTTVPYSTTARAVFGDSGRYLIGLTLITGSAGAANALLMGVSTMMTEMASESLLPESFLIGQSRNAAPVVFLAGLGSAFMLMGMAGEPELLLYMKGAMLLWLLHYAIMNASVFFALRNHKLGNILLMGLFGAFIFFLAFIVVTSLADNPGELIKAMLYLMLASTVFAASYVFLSKKKTV